jgi:hypothetical protein
MSPPIKDPVTSTAAIDDALRALSEAEQVVHKRQGDVWTAVGAIAREASARADKAEAERDAALAEAARLRAALAEAAASLPCHPADAHLTPPEADAEAVRQALLAALRGEA